MRKGREHLEQVEPLPPPAEADEPDEQGAAGIDAGPRGPRELLGHADAKQIEELRGGEQGAATAEHAVGMPAQDSMA